MTSSNDNVLIKLENISKSFGVIKALDNVSLELHKGEVLALAGHNGAGKSVLCKIMGGLYSADSGDMYFEGKKVNFHSPKMANEKGYYIVTQDLTVSKELSIADNIFIGTDGFSKFGMIATKKNAERAENIIKDFFGIDLDPKTLVGELDTVTQRIIQVVRGLNMGAKVLVFDETTAGLAHEERDILFEHIKSLTKKGIGIIFISHIISEMMNICDNVTVLRGGKVVATREIKSLTQAALIELIVGHSNVNEHYEKSVPSDEKLLTVSDLSTKNGALQDISFDVRYGEVLGVYGLRNQGQRLLLETIFGAYKKSQGEIYFKGKKLDNKSPIECLKNDIVYLANRGEKTNFLNKSIQENLMIQEQNYKSKGFFNDSKKEAKTAAVLAERFSVKGYSSIKSSLSHLSGGNMQKVLFARALALDPDLIMLVEPTEGIDIGAKQEIKEIILEMAKEGKGIIIVTSELDDIIHLCNRAIVLRDSVIKTVVEASENNKHIILESSIG